MADEQARRSSQASRFTLHKRGTFPAAGHDVAFSAHEGDKLTGRVEAKLTWDVSESPSDIVIHLSAFLVDADSRVPVGNPYYCVNHDNDRSKDGSTFRHGRRRHGDALEPETVTVVLSLVDPDVTKIVFAAYIQDATPLNHSFERMSQAMVTFTHEPDEETGASTRKIEEHALDRDYNLAKTAVLLGELHRRGTGKEAGWAYRNIGEGRSDLVEVGRLYGVVFIADDE